MLGLCVLCIMVIVAYTIKKEVQVEFGSEVISRRLQILVLGLIVAYWVYFILTGIGAGNTPHLPWLLFDEDTIIYSAWDLMYAPITGVLWTLVLIWVFKTDSKLVKLGKLEPPKGLEMWAWRALRVFGFWGCTFFGTIWWYILAYHETRISELFTLRTLLGYLIWVYGLKLHFILQPGPLDEEPSKATRICSAIITRVFVYLGIAMQIRSLVPVWYYCFREAYKFVSTSRMYSWIGVLGIIGLLIILCFATREALKTRCGDHKASLLLLSAGQTVVPGDPLVIFEDPSVILEDQSNDEVK